MVQACPECEKSCILRRKSQHPEWHCSGCGNDFDEPLIRSPNQSYNSDHVESLLDADPDIIKNRRKA